MCVFLCVRVYVCLCVCKCVGVFVGTNHSQELFLLQKIAKRLLCFISW